VNDPALAANCDFINHASLHCTSVFVYSTYVGEYSFLNNVHVTQIGGGGFLPRVKGVIRIFASLRKIVNDRVPKRILIHMNDKMALLICPILKLFGVKTNIWYSHAHASIPLTIANIFIDKVITTSKFAYPLKHKNLLPIGQLILADEFEGRKDAEDIINLRNRILHVGRVSKAKNLMELIEAIANIQSGNRPRIGFVGAMEGVRDTAYGEDLKQSLFKYDIQAKWYGPLKRGDIAQVEREYVFIFSGTRKAIDKSAVEGAIGGLLVISSNVELLSLVGMLDFYKSKLGANFLSLSSQIELLSIKSNVEELLKLSHLVSQTAINNCDMKSRIHDFLKELD
jgi:glycosyltransferase involved in cell wall biosynthesis